ncbi:MAG: sel1 repeat family protein [Elusimicrobia bacterium]|nr:sel1 repeat family protein [Elusimicrobiota bacterium]
MYIFYRTLLVAVAVAAGIWMGSNNFFSTLLDKAIIRHSIPQPVPEQLKMAPMPEAMEPIRDASAFGPSAEAYRAYAFADYDKARNIAYPLAKENDMDAQALLGDLCLRGKGLVQNYERAISYYQPAAVAGNRRAMYALGFMHENGLGVEKNIQQALEWYSKAAQPLFQPAPEQQEKWAKRPSQLNGLAPAQERLGVIYMGGLNGAPKDPAAGLRYLEMAFNNGCVSAATRLGIVFMRGKDLVRDIPAAYSWFGRAAELGDGKAQFYMALFRAEGFIRPKDYSQAYYWARRSAMNNDDDGQYLLATLYEKGLGPRKDPVRAATWYMVAATAKTPTGALADEANQRMHRSLEFNLYSQARQLADKFYPVPPLYYKDPDAFFSI